MPLFPSSPRAISPPAFGRWVPVPRKVGLLSYVSDGVARLDLGRPWFLPDLRRGTDLIAASDYSGEHRGARYDVLSCLLIDAGSLGGWDRAREVVRRRWLKDGRRLAFKNLRDRRHAQAIPGFLDAAEQLRGVVLTVALSKRLGPVFATPGRDRGPLCARWNDAVLEKVLRVTSVLSLLLAGLARPAQNVFWITDDDAIAATQDHLRDLTTALAYVSADYLTHDLGHLRCSTTSIQDESSRRIEDLASIPDLIAGTYAAYLDAAVAGFAQPPHRKYAEIVHWLGARPGSLARIFATITPDASGSPYVEVITLGEH